MTTHAIIRNGLRMLVLSLLAVCLSAVLPLPAQAGKNGGGNARHSDIVITKHVDKSTPILAKQKSGTSTKGTGQKYMTIKMNDANVSGYSR
ncbi:MAG TPA: type VI secretion system tube protein Hcp [Pseudolabrys sp.]|jgi:type VI protein secretion system component Hcp